MGKLQTFFLRFLALLFTAIMGGVSALIIGEYLEQPWATKFWDKLWPQDAIVQATGNLAPVWLVVATVVCVIIAFVLLRSTYSRNKKLDEVTPLRGNKDVIIQTKPLGSAASADIAHVSGVKKVNVKTVESDKRPLFMYTISTSRQFDIRALANLCTQADIDVDRALHLISDTESDDVKDVSNSTFYLSVGTK